MLQSIMVRRTGVARSAAELDDALRRLRSLEEAPDAPAARWMHSYALREPDGRFGLACLFEADEPQALRDHALRADLPAGEILPVTATRMGRGFAPALVYLLRRRAVGRDAAELDRRLATARRIADDMSRRLTWLRSHVVREADGTLGSVCLYQGVEPGALREHALRCGLPADEIVPVLGRIVFREDPAPGPGSANVVAARFLHPTSDRISP